MARCLLLEAKLPKELLRTYAVMASAYIHNRCCDQETPYTVLTGQKPDLSIMHVFRTTCYGSFEEKKCKHTHTYQTGLSVNSIIEMGEEVSLFFMFFIN